MFTRLFSILAFATLFLTIVVSTAPARGQSTGVISGTVVDRSNGTPLAGANILVTGTQKGAATRADGSFLVDGVPSGSHILRATYVGYRDTTVSVTVQARDTVQVELALRARAASLTGVRVQALRPSLQPRGELEPVEIREANPRDSGELLRGLSGLDAVRRGPVGLDPVVRGLRETEVGVYLDYTRLFPGGPARMDSPLSHLDPSFIESIEVVKGPYALTWGAGNLSAIRVTTKDVTDLPVRSAGAMGLAGYDANINAMESAASVQGRRDRWSGWLHGAWRQGNDYAAGNGEVVPADFLSREVRGKVGYRTASNSELILSGGYQRQDDIDYPGRLLNARWFKVHNYSAEWSTRPASGTLRKASVLAYYNSIDHLMDNTGKPTAQADPKRMPPFPLDVQVDANVDVIGGRAATTLNTASAWDLQVGTDVYSAHKLALRSITNANTGMVPGPLRPQPDLMWPDAHLTDAGVFVRADRSIWDDNTLTGTVRTDFVHAQADTASPFFRNEVSTELTDPLEAHVSGAVTLNTPLSRHWQVTGGLGSAVRTPQLKERYSDRIPASKAQTSAEFVGNPELPPERSTQLDLWLEGRYPTGVVTVNLFGRYMNGYVTLAPTDLPKRLPLSPETVYQYVSGTATFWGGEFSGRLGLTDFLDARLRAEYLWGQDHRTNGAALGVAPFGIHPGLRFDLAGSSYFVELRLHAVSGQDRVAGLRGETTTNGYVTGDIKSGIEIGGWAWMEAGVTNITDAFYVNHLNAKNPFTGQRIPEPGRVFYADIRIAL